MLRREFCNATLGSMLTYSLLETLFSRDAFSAEIKPVAAQWLASIDQLGRDVKGKKLKQVEWQKKIEELFAKADLPDILKFIDFEKLTGSVKYPAQGEVSLKPKFPEVEGLPKDLVFGSQVFALQKGRSVVPHGHDNMCTAFLILKGDFHGRHYDRLEDIADSMIIKPTVDAKFTVGGCSTVSDDKDNVHWFQATSETAFIFNIHVMSVKPGRTGRVYIDPNGEKLSDGRIRAKKLKHEEVYKLYG